MDAPVLADILLERVVNSELSCEEQIFEQLDSNGSGSLEEEDVIRFITSQGYVDAADDNEVKQQVLLRLGMKDGDSKVTKDDFLDSFRQRAKKSTWPDVLNINSTVLRLFLSDKTDDKGSAQVSDLTFDYVKQVLDKGLDAMTARIMQNLAEVKKGLSIPSAEEVNAKYAIAAGEEGQMSYGDISIYEGGLDTYIGLPSVKVVWAVVQEHCNSLDSLVPFKKQNGKETTPKAEFEFVTCVEEDLDFLKQNFPAEADELKELWTEKRREWPELLKPGQSRVRHSLARLWQEHAERIEVVNLRMIELIALILYTGPMYDKYNTSLRKFPKEKYEALHQNRYTSTIHTIASGLMKLAKAEKIPSNRKVYRGLGGKVLPKQFWKPDDRGCCGGVELGCMSTTSRIEVALQYSDKRVNNVEQGRPTICEIEIGQVDAGAAMNWCSQYPAEEEILFGPLCHIERMGRARVEQFASGLQVLVMPFRVNVNKKSLDLEQLEARRKLLHLATVDQLRWEADVELKQLMYDPQHDVHKMVGEARQRLEARRTEMSNERSAWYNVDDNYSSALTDSLQLKQAVVNSCQLLQKSAEVLGSPRISDHDEAVLREIEAAASPQVVQWLNRQRVSTLFDRVLRARTQVLSDAHRLVRLLHALDVLRATLQDPSLEWRAADDAMGSFAAYSAFAAQNKDALARVQDAALGRALEHVDNRFGPLPRPKDPDRYFREVLCCYKRALGWPVHRRSAMRILELFEEGSLPEVPEFPPADAWEARLFAHFCVGPDAVAQFPLRQLVQLDEPLVELSPGVTEAEAAFLAAFLSCCPAGREARVLIKGVSVPDKPLRLRTGPGWGLGHVVAGVCDDGLMLQELNLGVDGLLIAVSALEQPHAAPTPDAAATTAATAAADTAAAAAAAARKVVLNSNRGIGDERCEAVRLVLRLAAAARCQRLFLVACGLGDAHAAALAAGLQDRARLPALEFLSLRCNPDISGEGEAALRAAWGVSGRDPAALKLELDTTGFLAQKRTREGGAGGAD